MPWNHTYREGEIPPQGTITGTRPGYRIAQAITEIQDRCVNAVDLQTTDGIEGEAEIIGNKLILRISGQPSETPDDDGGADVLPLDGDAGMVLTRGSGAIGTEGAVVWDWVRAKVFT